MQSFAHFLQKAPIKNLLFNQVRHLGSNQRINKNVFTQGTPKFQPPKFTPEMKEATLSSFAEHMGSISVSENSLADPQSIRVQDIYKQMDSSLEGFFYKRKFTLKNFNFLLQILAEQRKLPEALKAFEKMKQLGITPDQVTYLQLLTASSKCKDATKSEQIFLEAKNNPSIGISLQLYNSLIMCYTRRHEPEMAEKILREMKDEGFKVCYTTVINAYKNVKNTKKCWELFDQALAQEFLEPDENFLGLMIEICAGSHDAEKAKKYFNDLIDMNFKETCLPYNAVIKALGSRPDYAGEAILYYQRMLSKHIIPDADTYVAVFKACSLIGDIKTAYNALAQMKEQNIPLSIYMYNGLLRTYAGACGSDLIESSLKEMYIEDAWNLFRQLQTTAKMPVSVNILNSLLLVHTKAYDIEKVEGLVLPLYEKYNLKKDHFTYQHIMEMYMKKKDLDTVVRLYGVSKTEGLEPSFFAMNNFLETAIRLQDNNMIIEGLQDFRKAGKEPKKFLLKKLGYAENMPDRIYLELVEFENKFGFAANKVKRYNKKDKYLTM